MSTDRQTLPNGIAAPGFSSGIGRLAVSAESGWGTVGPFAGFMPPHSTAAALNRRVHVGG